MKGRWTASNIREKVSGCFSGIWTIFKIKFFPSNNLSARNYIEDVKVRLTNNTNIICITFMDSRKIRILQCRKENWKDLSPVRALMRTPGALLMSYC